MTRSSKHGSFEDFVQWLGSAKHDSDPDRPVPDPQLLSAAREAWREHQSLQREQDEALPELGRAGRYVAESEQPVQSFWSGVFAALRDALMPHWPSVAITAAAVGAASLGLVLWNLRPNAPTSASVEPTALHFETRHGKQQTYRLADNSLLHLNTDSAVTVRYSQTQRLVLLTSGEAAFEVSHDPERTFRVLAGSADVVDLGTNFDVRLKPDATVVTVVEGKVAVGLSPMMGRGSTGARDNNLPRSVQVGANQQIRVVKGGAWPATPIAVDAQRVTAWLHRQIVFDHETLQRVAAEFNRYVPKPIEITTPALRDLEVGGVFSTDDPGEFLAFLRGLKGVTVDETATEIRVSQK